MCPIEWYDTLYFAPAPPGPVALACRWEGDSSEARVRSPVLPEGADNIVVRAIELLRDSVGVRRGAHLRLVKRIPLAAGLGGGSSDAAAALVAANVAWGLGLSRSALGELAARLGSDVPFFLQGGPAVCHGRGELVEPVADWPPLHLVVACPGDGLSTAEVYRACRATHRPRRAADVLHAVRGRGAEQAAPLLYNALAPVAARLSDSVERLQQHFGSLDFLGHEMSGSGTSYFGLCRSGRHARRLATGLRAAGLGAVHCVRSRGSISPVKENDRGNHRGSHQAHGRGG